MSARGAGLPEGAVQALESVRRAIAEDAAHRADDLRRAAEDDSADVLRSARAEADRILALAVAEGRAAAEIAAEDASSRARRTSTELVLAHREAARRRARDLVLTAARAMVRDEAYPQILRGLQARGRALLGPDAVVTEHPDGGVIVEAGSRRLDLSLPALAETTWERMTEEVRGAWDG